jgi:hypothetical protein
VFAANDGSSGQTSCAREIAEVGNRCRRRAAARRRESSQRDGAASAELNAP